MVLDGSSSPSGPSAFEDATPLSDRDPYSSSKGATASDSPQYHIDISSFPKPIPIIGPLLGFNDETFSKVLNGKIKIGTTYLKRPPTQEEATAYAYWTAKQISIFSYGSPIGVSAGIYRAYSTASTFRLPFWQPNMEKFNTTVFPSARLQIFSGNRAIMAWHALRMVAYGAVGNWIGQILFASYSLSVAAVGEMGDPRLKALNDAIKQAAQKKRGGLSNPMPQGTQQDTVQQRGGAPPLSQSQDDASLTGDILGDESAGFGSSAGGTMSDENLRTEEERRRPWPQASNSKAQMRSQEVPEQSYDEFDDASPTSGREVEVQKPQGSAWDRLRSGATPRNESQSSGWDGQARHDKQGGQSSWSKLQNTNQEESKEGSPDSFSFTKGDEDRNLAKIQAQKEFDALVDRERRGGDFNSATERRR
jgi:hypothetical protein